MTSSAGIALYGTALELTRKSWLSSALVGRTEFSNRVINGRSDDPRYLSAAAGRATAEFGNILRSVPGLDMTKKTNFGFMTQVLKNLGPNVYWLGTENDKTIKESTNQSVIYQLPEAKYVMIPEELNVAHVNLADDPASFEEGHASEILEQFTKEILGMPDRLFGESACKNLF